MDQEPFEEAECVGYDFPTSKANTLKVYCWNKEHGCQFEGSVEGMLRHYENVCTFHAVECLRCGQRLLHGDVSAHYVAGCSTDVSSAVTGNTPSVSTMLTLQDVGAALEELKTIMRDSNNDQLLLANQTQMNELTEQVRNLESRTAVSSREFGATASSEAVPISSIVSREPTPQQQNPTEGAGTSSTSRSCSEVVMTPQSRGPFAHLPWSVLRGMRKTTSERYPQHSVEYNDGLRIECHLSLTTPMPTNSSWREVFNTVVYTVRLERSLRASQLGTFAMIAEITVLHTKDSYFTVSLAKDESSFRAVLMFFGMRGDYPCSVPSLAMNVLNYGSGNVIAMQSYEKRRCICRPKGDSWVHGHRVFSISDAVTGPPSLALRGGMEFEIEISCENNVASGHSTG